MRKIFKVLHFSSIMTFVVAKYSFKYSNLSFTSSNSDIMEFKNLKYEGASMNMTLIVKKPLTDMKVSKM